MSLRVAVVGAGIAGLSAASQVLAERPDAEVTVYEASDRIGGKLKRAQIAGSWVDVGAEAMLARRPEGLHAAAAAGVGDQLIHPMTTAALLRIHGHNRPLPARTLLGIPTDLPTLRAAGVLSETALHRIESETAAPPLPPLAGDVTVGDLVADRFGREVVDHLVDPLLGGVYAGRAEDLSLQMVLPALAARLTRRGGSLLAAARELVPTVADPAPIFASLAGGLAQLPDAVAAQPGLTVRRSTAVRAVLRQGGALRLLIGSAANPQQALVDAVVLACPAGKSAVLVRELSAHAASLLAGISAASVVIVTLAYRGLATGALPAGSGILIPEVAALPVKAMTFSSQKWPGHPPGTVLLRGSLGRAGSERDLQLDDSELVAALRSTLRTVCGIDADPVDSHVQRWGGALPQYAIDHRTRVVGIRSALSEVPAIAVCGASYDGVGIPACIASGRQAATQVLAALAAVGQPECSTRSPQADNERHG